MSLTNPDKLKQSKITDVELSSIKDLALGKLDRQRVLKNTLLYH